MKVKTRFSPSPTGNLHIGSVRTALFSWLFAKHYKGCFVLRIEDTDLDRSKKYSIDSIIHGLKWLGLNWDEGPYFQSKRLSRYQEVINFMLANGLAYRCYCSLTRLKELREKQLFQGKKPRYDGYCRNRTNTQIPISPHVIRFCNPISGSVVFHDMIRGEIKYENCELDDLIIQRSNGMPTYNFAVVIDDSDMNITHVIRGEDHINNTPRQINILRALKKTVPFYAHLSMILNIEGKKISKRDINVSSILEFRTLGYLPEAVINCLARLGWSYGNQEIFSIDELKNLFSLHSISKSSSIFNLDKLLWYNNYYINNLSKRYIIDLLKFFFQEEKINLEDGPKIIDVLNIIAPRCNTLKQIVDSSKYFYTKSIEYDVVIIKKYLCNNSIVYLQFIKMSLELMSNWNLENLSSVIKQSAIQLNISFSKLCMLLRLAVTGKIYTPSINLVLYYLGKKKSLFHICNFENEIKVLNT